MHSNLLAEMLKEKCGNARKKNSICINLLATTSQPCTSSYRNNVITPLEYHSNEPLFNTTVLPFGIIQSISLNGMLCRSRKFKFSRFKCAHDDAKHFHLLSAFFTALADIVVKSDVFYYFFFLCLSFIYFLLEL